MTNDQAPTPVPAPPLEAGSPLSPAMLALPAQVDAYAPTRRLPALLERPIVRGMLAYLVGAVVLGGLAGLVWHASVDLPTYSIAADGGASTTERGITEFFAADAWFSVIGGVVGLVLGWLAWRGFRRIGWPVTVLALGAAALSALTCRWVGQALGPSNFNDRITAAVAGDVVPIDFRLRSWTGILVWLLLAVLPVMFGSSLGRDRGE